MAILREFVVLYSLFLLGAAPTHAQQFLYTQFSFETLGLSDGCFAVINETLASCPSWLPGHTGRGDASFDLLDDSQLSSLCGSSCQDDLAILRSNIRASCTQPNDTMVLDDGAVTYPATYLTDRYIYAAQLGCLKDSASGQYCDALVATWETQSNDTGAHNCSECELGIQKLQLSSPFGYDDQGATDFSSLTSSCSATGYVYATPTEYALSSSTTTSSAAANRTCDSYYTVQDEDICVSISSVTNVSTYGLITANGFDINCAQLSSTGESVCLPQKCQTYQLEMLDTCDSLTTAFNITMAQLLAWNPMFNSACNNLASWRGWYLCTSSPSGTSNVGLGNAATTAAPVPIDAQGQSNTQCAQWYTTVQGDYCSKISVAFSISLDDFYFLNPQVDSTCSNLWLNTSYCVEAVGNIATYSGYTTTGASETTFTRPPPEPTSSQSPVPTASLDPRASGTIDGCFEYDNAFDSTNNGSNSCQTWAWYADVTVDDLLKWNPSLSRDNCELAPGSSYCIRKSEEDASSPTLVHDYCVTANTTRIPSSSLQPTACSCYVGLRAEDKGIFNCTMFQSLWNVSVADVVSMNPWIGSASQCDDKALSSMTSDGYEQICIEKGGSDTSGT